jgi:hypothetical protein
MPLKARLSLIAWNQERLEQLASAIAKKQGVRLKYSMPNKRGDVI